MSQEKVNQMANFAYQTYYTAPVPENDYFANGWHLLKELADRKPLLLPLINLTSLSGMLLFEEPNL